MQGKQASPPDAWVTVGEAASLLTVHVDTLKRWERAGRISSVRTPTGHRRFRRGDVEALLQPSPTGRDEQPAVSA